MNSSSAARCASFFGTAPYFGNRLVPCAPAGGKPANAVALADHHCLVYSSRHRPQSWPIRDGDGELLKCFGGSRLALDSGEALRDAAVSGMGIAYLPDFLVADDLAAGRLRRVVTDLVFQDVDVVTIYPTRRLLEPRVRRFIDLLVEELGT